MNYQPEPSSVAARVIAYLGTRPAGSSVTSAELSHQLGVPASSFAGCLTSALNAGLVHKRWHDIAGGRGRIPASWPANPPAGRRVGFAGGLNPDNVAQHVEAIAGSRDLTYWIDMESGVRDDDNRFSLDKCQAVCEAVYGVKP